MKISHWQHLCIDKHRKAIYYYRRSNIQGGENMTDLRDTPTMQELCDTENLTQKLANLPEDKKTIITVMMNAFISGMDTQSRLTEDSK